MKKIFCLLAIILLVSCVEKNKTNQSGETILDKKYTSLSDTKKLKYLDSAFIQTETLENDSIKTKKLFEIASEYYNLSNFKSSYKASSIIYQKAIKEEDSFTIGKSLYFMGSCFHDSLRDSAYFYYKRSEKILRSLKKHKDLLAQVHYIKVDLLFSEGNYTESEHEIFKTLKILKTSKDADLEYKCYVMQGLIHFKLDELDKALYYFKKAQRVLEILIKEKGVSDMYYLYDVINIGNICNVYDEKGQYYKSIEELNKLVTPRLKSKFPKYYSIMIGNLGYSLMKTGNYKDSEKCFGEAIRITKLNNDNQGYLYKILDYAELYLLTKDNLKSKQYLDEALQLSRRLKSGSEILKSLDFLSQADKNNEVFYKNEYIRVNDSLIKRQRKIREKFARIEYETEQVEKENQTLSKRNGYLVLLALISFGLTIFAVVFFRLKAKNKRLLYTQEQQEANEKIYQLMLEQHTRSEVARSEERNRIAMELHDGIVNSIFTTRFNLGQLKSDQSEEKSKLISELENAEREIRRVSHDLQQNLNFNDNEMIMILNNLVDAQQNLSSTKFDLTIDKYIDWPAISDKNKIHLYRIIQEAIQNVHKYANAEKCFIFLLKTGNKTTLRIMDNGIGFNSDKVKEGIGLKNIHQRVQMMNGEIKIDSSSNDGTRIEVIF